MAKASRAVIGGRLLPSAEVFAVFLRLGLVSFGGPTAHIGYFHAEFVERRRWLSAHAFGELVALCQALPGPASSQLGFAIGLRRAGGVGALAAFAGFTLPSAAVMIVFAYGVQVLQGTISRGVVSGLMAVSVAVVAHAVMGMGRSLIVGWSAAGLASVVALVALLCGGLLSEGGALIQPALIALGAIAGTLLFREVTGREITVSAAAAGPDEYVSTRQRLGSRRRPIRGVVSVGAGITTLMLLLVLLLAAPALHGTQGSGAAALVDTFSRAGAFVFGGGHAVLPLLEAGTVQSGWLSPEDFLAGYSLAQAVPGPMFSVAAYLGVLAEAGPGGVAGGVIAILAIFTPGFLLLVGVLPFWEALQRRQHFSAAVRGASVAVVGILAAALVHPVATGGLTNTWTVLLAVLAFVMLCAKAPPWSVVLLGAAVGLATALGSLA
ncbi:chromate efflux transporter [Leucobacter sp. NPDC015123]|uniref:chromate efflux transporter n=1 Tax=Leucobacter sp. NPDC015123 TaxID=3364129 RepID=UPI0036F451CF